MKKSRNLLYAGIALILAFVLWTLIVLRIDVQPVGPQSSRVGLATMNTAFHRLTGEHMALYTLTDNLSILPLAFVPGFALLGLVQLIRRRSLLRVDGDILALGVFYAVVLAAFALFEVLVVNYRPVLIEGVLEASYPSSTTLLVLTVLPTAMMQLGARIRHAAMRRTALLALLALTVLMTAGRIVSGVHWLSDIIGGMLLAAGLDLLYAHFARALRAK